MNKVKIPDSLSVSGWNSEQERHRQGQGASLQGAGRKRPSSTERGQGARQGLRGKVDFGLGDAKGLTAATAGRAALAKLDDGRQVGR